ncbi:hypothetical protein KVA01_09180 [Kocuria varians]|uniref:Uncharacterized protein n=1 Tax=Kocuria varians TaxID=1272 RepID=A0A4Y4D5D3_KOCVA|nr:hypothetical protein KVA01_09180 [Kocuria varians]
MHCTSVVPALAPVRSAPVHTVVAPLALPAILPPRSAIYHRRLTAQVPLRGHRVVAARLSKIP